MAAPHKIGKRTERRLSEIETTLEQLQEKMDRLITVFENVMIAESELLEVESGDEADAESELLEVDAEKDKGKRKSKKEDPDNGTE